MTETHYRTRARNLRRIFRWLVALEILLSVGLVMALATRPRITIPVTIAGVAGALVIVLFALALRLGFRNLPDLERLSSKFDDEADAHKTGAVQRPE